MACALEATGLPLTNSTLRVPAWPGMSTVAEPSHRFGPAHLRCGQAEPGAAQGRVAHAAGTRVDLGHLVYTDLN
jgi:hypothetical protein